MEPKVAIDLLDRVSSLLAAVDQDLGERVMAAPDAYVLWLFSRARSTFLASKLLIENRLIDEAMVLTRALVTDALRLMKLERAGDGRPLYVLSWVHDSIGERENLFRSAASLGLEAAPDEALAVLAEERQKLLRYQRRHKLSALRRFPHEKQLAAEFKLEPEYWDFEYVNNLVHGSPAMASRRFRSRSDVLLVATFDDGDAWVAPAVGMSCQWVLRALSSFRVMFAPSPVAMEAIGALMAEIETHFERADRTNDG